MIVLQKLFAFFLFFALTLAGPTTAGRNSYRSLQAREDLTPPHYAAPSLPAGIDTDEQPTCYYARGIAYVQPTVNNIQHLLDVGEQNCTAEANDCVRVSYLNQSGLFFCNHNAAMITTKCQNLINLAYKLHYSCQISNYYTFGIVGGTVQNGSDSVGYYLRIGGETP
ncbi:hypothetical protein POX_f07356 [Penicillium oxalicum]|uniref:hypothetical protein n=1 Tax=Penicillium oxalicum TaxID=69781 RepID=UPI0020B797B8|nr:hypothetical protein POX_f07356 [Penicillium oxalicum]KAI2787003.1 hypothetical protein POX_f07356 [Penicillium oxalicum]